MKSHIPGIVLIVLFVTFASVSIGFCEEKPSNDQQVAAQALPEKQKKETDVKSNKPITMDTVIVTAKRIETLLRDAPASVSIIDNTAIESSPVLTVDDLLETEVGVDGLESDLTEKTKRSVRLRGVGDQGKTLVLFDGIPLNWPIHGDVEWNAMSIDNIEKIEIVRGPASSLYGSHAMGGVINVMTKAPESPFEGKIKQNYGTNNTLTSTLSIGGRGDKVGYYLSGRHRKTDGYLSSVEDPLPPNSTKNEHQADTLNGRLYFFPGDESRITLGGLYSDKERNRGTKFDNADRKTGGAYVTYVNAPESSFEMTSNLYWHTTDYSTDFENDTYDAVEHIEDKYSTHWGGMLQSSHPFADSINMTFGLEFRHNRFHQDDTYLLEVREAHCKGKQDYWSLYTQDEFAFIDNRLLLTLGLRGDWWRSYDGQCEDTSPSRGVEPYDDEYESEDYLAFNPKFGLVFHLNKNTNLRSSVGMGFQAPNLFEMYRTFQRGRKLTLSNPDLDPEKLISYEFGIDHSFDNGIFSRLTYYDSYGSDFIGSRPLSETVYQVDNFTKVRMWGIEAELKYFIDEYWSCFANYTFSEVTIEKNDPDPSIEGNYMSNSPRNKVNVGVTYSNRAICSVTALAKYVDKMYTDSGNEEELDDYVTLDLKLRRNFGDHLSCSLNCENVFDTYYEIPDHSVQKAPGRFWSLSVAYDF